jgi:glycerophosphoryl diester phosphodiesterase
MLELREFVESKDLLIVAHRGSSGTAPENTLSAFREALIAGVNMIETDIQFTSDGYVIAFHDDIIARTTNGKGSLGEMDLNSIKNLDAGSWFDKKYSGEKIPLLSEVIDLIYGKAYLIIEIKSLPGSETEQCIDIILNDVYKKNYENYTIFASYDHKLLELVKNKNTNLHTAAIKNLDDDRLPSEIKKEINFEGFICSIEEINDKIAEDALINRIFVGVYPVDTINGLEKVLSHNVKAIATNYPERIINYLNFKNK